MPAPPSSAARPGRRAVLRAGLVAVTGAGVLGLSSCRLRVGSPDRTPSTVAPEPTADELALDRARLRADQLAVTYAQAARLRADLATPLRQLAADHTAHVQAIQALRSPAPGSTSSATSSGSPTSSGTASAAPTTSPALTAVTALSALGQAERTAVAEGLADLGPVGPQAARLLASIAACSSAHVVVLARLPRSATGTGRATGSPTTAAP